MLSQEVIEQFLKDIHGEEGQTVLLIFADYLEENGVDVSKLRNRRIRNVSIGHGYGSDFVTRYGYGNGYGDLLSGIGNGYWHGYFCESIGTHLSHYQGAGLNYHSCSSHNYPASFYYGIGYGGYVYGGSTSSEGCGGVAMPLYSDHPL